MMTTLIGTNPDQVPVNSMLGGMAYQDPDSVSVKDLSSSGTANITDVSYSGTLTGGTGIINIGSGQVYKDASGNVGIGIVPSGNKLAVAGTGYVFKIAASGTQYNGFGVQCTDASESVARNVFYGIVNEAGATIANMVGDINTDGSSGWSWMTQSPGTRTDRRSFNMRLTGFGDLELFGTGAIKLQEGTTAQRPSTPLEGMIRKNSSINSIEAYSGAGWVNIESGRFIARTAYQSAGTFTFTPNSKTKFIIFEIVSGGAGSGGVTATNASQAGVAMRGRNGKRVVGCIPYSETIGASYSVVVGVGGAAGAGSAATAEGGGPGGASSITNNTTSNAILVAGGTAGSSFGNLVSTFVASFSDFAVGGSTAGSHYTVWSQPSTTNRLLVFNTSGGGADLYERVSPNGSFGLGGLPVVTQANDPDGQNGMQGFAGEVILYEYS